ncbi:MAG: tetratricopeptide repeat protein [Polyangiales bacterium]
MRKSVARFGLLSLVCSLCISGCGTSMLDAKTRGWVVVDTADLRVRSDAGAEQVVEMAARYQRMHDAIAEHELPCGFDRLTLPLEVTLFKQYADPSFHRVAQTNLLGLRAQIVVHTASQNDSVDYFTHELTHRLLSVCFPTATAWLHEGMASFYQTARLHEDTLELGFPPYATMPPSKRDGHDEVYEITVGGRNVLALPASMVPGATELRMMSRAEFYDSGLQRKLFNYAGAWTLVHLLRLGDMVLSPRFAAYLQMLQQGRRESTAWQESFGDYALDERYTDYLAEDPFSRVRSVQVAEPEDLVARPMSQGEAALMLAQLEDWGDDKAEKRVRAYIDFAVEQSSTQRSALLLRGAVSAVRGDVAGAERSFETALELDPSNPDALAALIHFHMDVATKYRSTAAKYARRAQELTRAATRAYHFAVAASWLTYVDGDAWAGLALAERAVELDGTSFMAYVTAGDAAAALGQLDKALGAYQAALALSRAHGEDVRHELEARMVALRERSEASGPKPWLE